MVCEWLIRTESAEAALRLNSVQVEVSSLIDCELTAAPFHVKAREIMNAFTLYLEN